MTTGGAKSHLVRGAATAALALCAGLAHGQDAAGLEAEFTFSQGLTYSDVDGSFARTTLGFGLSSATRSQTFDLQLGTVLEHGFDGGSDANTIDPSASLSYGIESRQTAVNTSLSYRQADADDVFEDPNGILGDLVFDDGTREDSSADLTLDFGREAPFGGTFSLGYDETNFTDTASPDLVDTVTRSAGLSLRFDIDSRIAATLGYTMSDTDRASGRDTRSERLTLGANLTVTPTIDANVSVGLREITVTDGGIITQADGVTYGLGITQARPNGSLTYSLESDLSEAGRRTTATVGTSIETRRGTLSTSLGITDGVNSGLRPLLTLGYSEDLPRGSYSVDISQDFSTDADGDEVLNSRLRLAWRQDLNSVSRVTSDLTYQISDRLNLDDDTSRLELGVQYSHDLTEAWAVSTRYSYSVTDDDGASREKENEIFIGLETAIGWRP